MPELNEVLDSPVTETPITETQPVVNPVAETPAPKAKAKAKKAKPAVTPEVIPETPEATESKPEKKSKAKKEPKEPAETKFVRPPIEQLTIDFEAAIKDLEIDGKPIVKLGYKCGKIIYGIPNTEGKDFRILAFKARKKSKSVDGKSRAVFFFGTTTHKNINVLGAKASKFGKCAVQSKAPTEISLDKITFTDIFNKDATLALNSLVEMTKITIEHKSEIWAAKKEESKTE